jgi:hypothetical protein
VFGDADVGAVTTQGDGFEAVLTNGIYVFELNVPLIVR